MSEKNTKATETVEIDPGMSVMPEAPGLMDVPTVIPELDSVLAAMPAALPAYQTTAWKNKPSTETPIDAAAMTRIERRLVDLTNAVNGLRDSVGQIITVDLGTVQIGEKGYYSLASNEAYVAATSGMTKKLWALRHYDSMAPYGPFSVIGEFVIGQPNTRIERLRILVWVEG